MSLTEKDIEEIFRERPQRTKCQNRALHTYFEILAQELNNAGLDQRKVLKPSVDIPWTKEAVKTQLWKPIQDAMIGKDSTTELNTKQVSEVYEVLNRHIGMKHGVSVQFPEQLPNPNE